MISVYTGCSGKPADVVFVLDASSNTRVRHFRIQLDLVRNLARQFDISPSWTRVGLITYCTSETEVFGLNAHTDKHALLLAVNQTVQARGCTRTDGALLHMRNVFASEARPDVPKIAVVITDGKSEFPAATRQEASLAHAAGITVFAIGIGHKVEKAELEAIASRNEYIFTVNSLPALKSIRDLLALGACAVQHIPEEEDNDSEAHFAVIFQDIDIPKPEIIQYQGEGYFEPGIVSSSGGNNPRYNQRLGEGWNMH